MWHLQHQSSLLHKRHTRNQLKFITLDKCQRCANSVVHSTGRQNVSLHQGGTISFSGSAATLAVCNFPHLTPHQLQSRHYLQVKVLLPRSSVQTSDNTTMHSPSLPWGFWGGGWSHIKVVAHTPFRYRVSCATDLALSLLVREKNRCLCSSTSITQQPHLKPSAETIPDSTCSRSRPYRMYYGIPTPMLPSITMHTNSYSKRDLKTSQLGFTALETSNITTSQSPTRLPSLSLATRMLKLSVHTISSTPTNQWQHSPIPPQWPSHLCMPPLCTPLPYQSTWVALEPPSP